MDIGQIARRFPLVARPRPACLPLSERVQEINNLARSAEQHAGLRAAAVAQNMAALLASDCGLPDLARSLCWRHAEAYLCAHPLDAQEGRYSLEPLINLARLHIRDGNGEAGYQLLDALHTAVRSRTEAVIDGRPVSFRNLTATQDDHREVSQWLWAVLLGEGTRALATTGQWGRAAAHARQNKGVGNRLLDGRQAEAIALCLGGNPTSALHLVHDSTLADDWEHAVATCLTALCLTTAGQPHTDASTNMVYAYLALDVGPKLAMFRTRLGLTVLDLCQSRQRTEVRDRVIGIAAESGDAYVARDVLEHEVCGHPMSAEQRQALTNATASAGLGHSRMPQDAKQILLKSVDISATATCRLLTR